MPKNRHRSLNSPNAHVRVKIQTRNYFCTFYITNKMRFGKMARKNKSHSFDLTVSLEEDIVFAFCNEIWSETDTKNFWSKNIID